MKPILLSLIFAFFLLPCFAQERDILDYAAKNPNPWQVQNPDGTWRTPKYGDYQLEQAVERLKNYSQPFTVPKVISWYLEAKDEKIRAAFLRVLAVSRDPRAALILGNARKDDSLDVAFAAMYGLRDYFLPSIGTGGTEQQIIAVQQWWEKNRERLEMETKGVESKATPSNSMNVSANKLVTKSEVSVSQQENPILSKDHATAEKALDKAILEKDKHTIKLGLRNQSFLIRQKTVEAIGEIGDESFVPDLIRSLRGNQGIVTGGTETEVMQNDLNRAIISALEQLTKLEFEVSIPLSDEDIRKVTDKSQNWFIDRTQTNSKTNTALKQNDKILSRDMEAAKKGLTEALENKDKETLRLGLKNHRLLLGEKNSEAMMTAIIEMKDITFVPNLTEALERNRGIIAGGGESQGFQNHLTKVIVKALQKLTGLHFDISNSLTLEGEYNERLKEINEVIKQSREWYKTHQQECKSGTKKDR
jgi:HEAT repeat protein